jgi:integrase
MFTWAIRQDLVERTPFKKHGEVVIKQARELHRRRRLHQGERERLLSACGSHLRSVVEAALETGCRLGELLSLQWHQVRFDPRAEIFLPAKKTKTKRDRTIPMSTRLRQMLEMRPRHLPDGTDMPPTGHVFGNEIGEPIKGIKRGWESAVLKAHGHRPQYVVRIVTDGERRRKVRTGLLTPECRAALRAIDLHFHDLRREAGSRWLDAGTPLHKIQRWLGHAKVSQTATYLTDAADDDAEAMRRFEARQAELQQIATDSKAGGMNRALDTTIANTKAENYSVKH